MSRQIQTGDSVLIKGHGLDKFYTIRVIQNNEIFISPVDDQSLISKLIFEDGQWKVFGTSLIFSLQFISGEHFDIPKLVVIGGSPYVDEEKYRKIDPNFITIGFHDGMFKDLDWNKPNYWSDVNSALEFYHGKICCVILDEGSESWLNTTNLDQLNIFISQILTPNGLLIMSGYHELVSKLIQGYKFYLNGIFYVGNPNDTFFERLDIVEVYSRKPNLSDDIYDNGMFYHSSYDSIEKSLDTLDKRAIVRKTGAPYIEKIKILLSKYCE